MLGQVNSTGKLFSVAFRVVGPENKLQSLSCKNVCSHGHHWSCSHHLPTGKRLTILKTQDISLISEGKQFLFRERHIVMVALQG